MILPTRVSYNGITPAFQADNASSILATRSSFTLVYQRSNDIRDFVCCLVL
jgi:hypothetical protein